MRLEVLEPSAIDSGRWVGALLCRDVQDQAGRTLLLKGRRLAPGDGPVLAASNGELHLLWLDPGDVDEDRAATRLAEAIAGPGVEVHPPVESQVRLSASWRGVARVDAETLAAINSLDGVTIFTVPDGMPVDPGRSLAGVKVTPLAVPESTLAEAVRRAAPGGHAVSVASFLPRRVAALVRQRITDAARRRFERSLSDRVAWFGGSVTSLEYPTSRDATRGALRRVASAADLVLVVGAASVDPLESTWVDLLAEGASVIRRGLPVHPGSSYWLARLGAVTVIGVASCGMLSRRSALDLLLTRWFAGEPLDDGYLARLGHGGLLGAEQGWRIPPYAVPAEADE